LEPIVNLVAKTHYSQKIANPAEIRGKRWFHFEIAACSALLSLLVQYTTCIKIKALKSMAIYLLNYVGSTMAELHASLLRVNCQGFAQIAAQTSLRQ
jgi:hypothetical protein